jgi:serine/threonine-protein kinase
MMTIAVAHYRLKERLGSGAMGEVWLAEDTRLHRLVALKMLRADTTGDDAAGARLLREARVASALSHPNVAVIYEVGEAEAESEQARFIAMEYVKGRTLGEVLKDGPLTASAVLPIGRQVAEALAGAHQAGIVHRDVKPGNVMLTDSGVVKVLDFGLARFAPPSSDVSATWSGHHGGLEAAGTMVGTLAYMSPEQVRGTRVDGRSDIFSLGVLLHELLSGRRPFDGSNAVEVIDAILREAPRPLAAEGPLARGLASLVARMLEKEPSRRPLDMREVLRDLDAIGAGQAVAPMPGRDVVVAVLAFSNITGRADDAWLGSGLAETVAAGLGAVPGLVVVSRERILEAVRALGHPINADDPALAVPLGMDVGAGSVVTGAFQGLGEQIRVTARVTDTASGRATLNAKVDGTRAEIFALQDRLVAELVEGLRGQLPEERPRPEDTQSLEAYEAFSKGLLNLRAESQESIERAIVFFERAIALDPGYARAHMQLGVALDLKGDFLGVMELSERGMAAIERALALRPDHAEAWRYLGGTLISLGRDAEALAAFERALEIDPTDVAGHNGVARIHFILRGDFARAVPAYERALAVNPRSGWSALQLAHCATLIGDFAKAEAAARRATELQQSYLSGRTGLVVVGAFMRLGHVFAAQGRHREALDEYAREIEWLRQVDHALRGRLFIELYQRIGEAHLRLGDAAGAAAALDLALEAWERRLRSGADDPGSPYYAACAYALRGDTRQALACLERAAVRRPRLTAARAVIEPALASLRGEPRFRAVTQAPAL